jgi:hypothetical protein
MPPCGVCPPPSEDPYLVRLNPVNINIQILIESDEWFRTFTLSEPLVERRAFERRAKREIQKMNAWALAIQGKKLSGERKANLEKMSECPALSLLRESTFKWWEWTVLKGLVLLPWNSVVTDLEWLRSTKVTYLLVNSAAFFAVSGLSPSFPINIGQ